MNEGTVLGTGLTSVLLTLRNMAGFNQGSVASEDGQGDIPAKPCPELTIKPLSSTCAVGPN